MTSQSADLTAYVNTESRISWLAPRNKLVDRTIPYRLDIEEYTHVCRYNCSSHVEWKPDLVIVDEAGRMTEAMAMIPAAKCPYVAIM